MERVYGRRPDVRLFLIIALTVGTALSGGISGTLAAGPDDTPPSIHQLESRRHEGFSPVPLAAEPSFRLLAPGTLSTPAVTRQVMGFYPYWSSGTANLQWDLLTILAYFSADATSAGSLSNLHGWPSSAPIAEAHAHGVKVVLTVTLFGSDSIRTLIQSSTNRSTLIANLYNQVSSASADGVCVDFESPYASDRGYFNTFVQELSGYFHTHLPGSHVSVCTGAVNWSDRFDYDTLTDACDALFIMAYDYYWSGGSPGPVSPRSHPSGSPWATWASVEATIQDYISGTFGVGPAKRHKLYVGLPYYGYDWPTTSYAIPGTAAGSATAVIYSTAAGRAVTYGRHWDDWSDTPYYLYTSGSQPHQCWYDDDESLGLKWDLVNGYDLGGTGMWALNYDGSRPELWDTLREKFAAPVPGTLADPIPIDANPYVVDGTTLGAPSRVLDAYSCAPSTNESGPEVCYKLTTSAAGDIFVTVSDGPGVDIDVHILNAPAASACLDRGHWTATAFDVPAGDYWIIADTWVDSGGTEYAGPYTLTVEFVPADEWVEEPLAEGVVWRRKSYPDLFATRQFVNVIDISPTAEAYVQPLFTGDGTCLSPPDLAGQGEVLAAVNAGWAAGCTPTGLIRSFGVTEYDHAAGVPARTAAGRNYFGEAWLRAVDEGQDWPQAHFAAEAGPRLVRGGAVSLETAAEGFDASLEDKAARTALGVTADNHVLLVTVDAVAGLGTGMTLAELAQYMLGLDCREAMLLGGGTPTTMYVAGTPVGGVANLPPGNGEPDHLGAAAVPLYLGVTAIAAPDSDGDGLHDDVDPNPAVRHLDLNGDGAVDALDLAILAAFLAGNQSAGVSPFLHPECADADLDGRVDAVDLVRMAVRMTP
jgi:spore germination protein YaaH